MSDQTKLLLGAVGGWLLIGWAVVLAAQSGLLLMASYGTALFIASPITFVIYGLDKRRAQTGGWRIPENVLHLGELLGGWPGAFAAQQYFRHKTQDSPHLSVYYGIVTLHIILIGLIAMQSGK